MCTDIIATEYNPGAVLLGSSSFLCLAQKSLGLVLLMMWSHRTPNDKLLAFGTLGLHPEVKYSVSDIKRRCRLVMLLLHDDKLLTCAVKYCQPHGITAALAIEIRNYLMNGDADLIIERWGDLAKDIDLQLLAFPWNPAGPESTRLCEMNTDKTLHGVRVGGEWIPQGMKPQPIVGELISVLTFGA